MENAKSICYLASNRFIIKIQLFTFIFFCLISSTISGQSCHSNGISFSTQSEVDQFPILNPGCEKIGGDLIVQGSDITNLDSLYSIEVIEGDFKIYANFLENFNGLNNLDTIKQELFIAGSAFTLTNFEGLEQLKVLGINENYHVLKGSSISDFSGLDSLQSVNGTLAVSYCYNLTSFAGLEKVNDIQGIEVDNCSAFTSLGFSNEMNISHLSLEALPLLTNLNGIELVNSINSIELIDLSTLTSIDSLSSIPSIQDITIDNCDMLTDINGLQGLSEIQNSLTFRFNNILDDITALNDVDLSILNSLEIAHNPSLSSCQINSICYYLGEEGNSTINNNEVGCNDENDVLITCCSSNPDLCPDSIYSCLPDGIIFNSQAEVDVFSSVYSGCKKIGGDVTINGSDITHLDSLYSIEVIEGSLTLLHNSLSNFEGLNNLDTLKQEIFISDLGSNLINFIGLESLKFIGNDLNQHYISNAGLEDFKGLDSLQRINGNLTISNCQNLNSLAGLKSLTQIHNLDINNCSALGSLGLSENFDANELSLYNLPSLSNLDGLEYLQSANVIELERLDSLTSIDSLYALVSLSRLDIKNCDLLTNLNGLYGLTGIENSITLQYNDTLSNISALSNADFTTLNMLSIQNNPSLSICDINSICNYISIDGSMVIEDNKIGCNTIGEIIVECCANDPIWCPSPEDNCLSNGITFSSQGEVDIFSLAYPGCKIIGGDVIIDGLDISSLDSLYSIEVINGDLSLYSSSIPNFQGLNNLDSIKQEFSINSGSSSLVNFEGLESLKLIGSEYSNDHSIMFVNIEDFSGLDSLQTINGTLEIVNCYNLYSLSGLEQLSEIYQLEIRNCQPFTELGLSHNLKISGMVLSELTSLENLDGIEFVDSIFSLRLSYLNELVSIDSLYSLNTISALTIENCNKLKNLNGLEGLTEIQNYFLRLEDNKELNDISALNDVDISTLNSLTIRDNPKLSTCNINSICEYIDMGGNTTIFENAVGCKDENEVIYDCGGNLSIFVDNESSFTGNSNNYWHNTANWKNNEIPTESSYVIIPIDYDCLIQSDSIATCKILELKTGATLICGDNGQLNVLVE